MIDERTAILQAHYINMYAELFWIILRLGGCVLQQQVCRLLNNNKSDTTANTALIKKLEEAKLIKIRKIGSNSVLIITYPVLKYFGVNRTVKYKGVKIKRSAMILEKYLREGYYKVPILELKRRLQKTAALSFMVTGEPHLRLINAYTKALLEKGWQVDGLKHQEKILLKRFDYQTKFTLYENYPPLDLGKEANETDLYNLECQNSFITGIRMENRGSKKQLIITADIYNILEKNPIFAANLALLTMRTIEGIFADYKNSNFVEVEIHVYSHQSYSEDYTRKFYEKLCVAPEFLGQEELARRQVKLTFFDSKTRLFSNIDPSAIV